MSETDKLVGYMFGVMEAPKATRENEMAIQGARNFVEARIKFHYDLGYSREDSVRRTYSDIDQIPLPATARHPQAEEMMQYAARHGEEAKWFAVSVFFKAMHSGMSVNEAMVHTVHCVDEKYGVA